MRVDEIDDRREMLGVGILLSLAAMVLIGTWIGLSYMEARTFERLTGKHVTTWDAMWVELRVQEPVKGST